MDDDPLPLAPPVIPPGEVAGLVPPQHASPAAFHLRREKYMIENGFEVGVRLVVAALVVVGLACILFVGVTAAVLLVLARRSFRGVDDDTGDDRQDYQHTVAAEKSAPTKMPGGAGAGGASSNNGRNSPAAVAASAPSRRRIM